MEKFLFNTNLDPDAVHEPEAPSFSEDDLEAVKHAARAEGHAQGFTEASEGMNKQIALLLDGLSNQMTQIMAQASVFEHQKSLDATRLALAITQKILPDYCQRHGVKEIEALIKDCLEESRDEPRLVIRLSDKMLDHLKAQIEEMTDQSGYEGRVIILADARLSDLDCLVEWADGGAERSIERLWKDITMRADRALPGSIEKPDLLALQQAALQELPQETAKFAAPAANPAPSQMGLPEALKETPTPEEETKSSEDTQIEEANASSQDT